MINIYQNLAMILVVEEQLVLVVVIQNQIVKVRNKDPLHSKQYYYYYYLLKNQLEKVQRFP